MKKLNLLLGLIIFTSFSFQSYSQEYTLEDKTVIGIFNADGQSKSEIFSAINKWIALNYNSAQNVVQLNDKKAGNIIVKGINGVEYKNAWKEFYPNNKYMEEHNSIKFNHTIEINIKENKYRIIYTLTNIITKPVEGYNLEHQYDLIFGMVNFTGIKQENIDPYNSMIKKNLKKGWIGKKKRQEFLEMTKPTFEEMNEKIIKDIKSTMLSIKKTVSSTKNDDW